jgi:hypothetical protein
MFKLSMTVNRRVGRRFAAAPWLDDETATIRPATVQIQCLLESKWRIYRVLGFQLAALRFLRRTGLPQRRLSRYHGLRVPHAGLGISEESNTVADLSPKRRATFPFAIGGELSAISLRSRFINGSWKFCCTAIYGETDLKKLACEVDLRPARQTHPGKLAREVDVPSARDNALVPDQKEHRDDILAA